MGLFKGGALRLFQTFLYALLFCCAAIILGIFSYFLSVLADRNAPIADWKSAVEGLSGAATLYLIFAVLLTCCFGGITFLAILAIILDILFCGAMIAIAVLTRHGANNCSGFVRTPLGNGQANSGSGSFGGDITYRVSLRTACELNTACFAVAIIGAFLFLCTAALQILLMRHHKKEKRYGPGPDNNYTEGSGKKTRQYPMWRRKPREEVNRDAELGTVPVTGTTAAGLAADHQDIRPSHETGYTGSTAAGEAVPYEKIDPQHHRGTSTAAPHGTHGGYYTQPQGTGVNPYGYETAAPTTYTTGTATNY